MSYAVKELVMSMAKAMYDKNMVNALEGNISAREGDRIYITPSGICKGTLTPDMIAVTDLDGVMVEGEHAPSSEIKMHLAAYRLRDDIASVVHTHSPFATAYAIANKPIETRAYTEMIYVFDKIPVVPYGTPSTDEVHAGFAACIHQTDVFLIAHHGIVSVGKDVYDAFFKIEAAESIAKTLILSRLLGGESAIPDEKIDELYAMRKEKLGKDRVL